MTDQRARSSTLVESVSTANLKVGVLGVREDAVVSVTRVDKLSEAVGRHVEGLIKPGDERLGEVLGNEEKRRIDVLLRDEREDDILDEDVVEDLALQRGREFAFIKGSLRGGESGVGEWTNGGRTASSRLGRCPT